MLYDRSDPVGECEFMLHSKRLTLKRVIFSLDLVRQFLFSLSLSPPPPPPPPRILMWPRWTTKTVQDTGDLKCTMYGIVVLFDKTRSIHGPLRTMNETVLEDCEFY